MFLVLALLFLVSRAVYFAVGVRFDMVTRSPPQYLWQLLGPGLLQHHLLVSVWHLDSQPPLFNFCVGLLLKLPYGAQPAVATLTFLALGLVIVLFSYAVLLDFGVNRWFSFGVAVFILVSPSYILYENWLSYAYPTSALLIVSVWCLNRYLRTRSLLWGVSFFSAVALVFLLNSTYQLLWILLALLIVVVCIRQWRACVLAALPLLIAVAWLGNDVLQFGTVTTSSWLGMNLTKTTLLSDYLDRSDLQLLIHQHVLTPIATVLPFAPVHSYVPRYTRPRHTGVTALDARSFENGRLPNFNNLAYVSVSNQYLHDDLHFILSRPGKYSRAVFSAVKVWNIPPDEYFAVEGNRHEISGWADVFDRAVLLRLAGDASAPEQSQYYVGGQPTLSQLSLLEILINAVSILGLPILIWKRRRGHAWTGSLTYLWMTIVYAFLVTSFVELGENQRFAMELAPLPLVGFAAVVSYPFLSRRQPPG